MLDLSTLTLYICIIKVGKNQFKMSKVRSKLREKFSQVPNELIFDDTLSDRARFIFIWMNAKPDNWEFYMGTMSKEIGLHEDTLRKCIKELIEKGWIKKCGQSRKGQHNERFGSVDYIMTDERFNFE